MMIDRAAIASRLVAETASRGDGPGTDTARQLVDAAAEMITAYLGAAVSRVPDLTLQVCVLETARELHTRSLAPGGIMPTIGDGTPLRLARDPMRPVLPILAPYRDCPIG